MIKIYQSQLAKDVVAQLLKINAIKLQPKHPFTWASGWKSPIYCDNRLSLSFPEIRSKIKTALALAISNSFGGVDTVAGVATAGIPQGVLVAQELGLPFIYVRSKPKGHGLKNLIEGELKKGENVVLVEDLISTGGSSLAAANAVKQVGGNVVGIVAIFTYGFREAVDNFNNEGIDLVVLSDYNHLLDYAQDERMFENDTLKVLKEWRENPATWGI